MESSWHKKVRENIKNNLEVEGYIVKNSHQKEKGKLPLFYKTDKQSIFTSDVDIIAFKDNQVKYIIEIQSTTRPKDIIGIIGTINLSTIFSYSNKKNKIDYNLKDIILYIVTKPLIKGSKKQEQFNMIKEEFELNKGCLSYFKICTENDFQITY